MQVCMQEGKGDDEETKKVLDEEEEMRACTRKYTADSFLCVLVHAPDGNGTEWAQGFARAIQVSRHLIKHQQEQRPHS